MSNTIIKCMYNIHSHNFVTHKSSANKLWMHKTCDYCFSGHSFTCQIEAIAADAMWQQDMPMGSTTLLLHKRWDENVSWQHLDCSVTYIQNMMKVECDVATRYGYLCLWTPPCKLLLNIKIKMLLDNISTGT